MATNNQTGQQIGEYQADKFIISCEMDKVFIVESTQNWNKK